MTATVLSVVLILWPFLSFAGGLGFSPIVGLAGLCLLPAARTIRFQPYMAVLAAFFVFAALSALWSPHAFELVDINLAEGDFNVRSEVLRVGLQFVALGVIFAAVGRLNDIQRVRVNKIAVIALGVQAFSVVLLAMFETSVLQLLAPLMSSEGEGVQNLTRNSLIMAAASPWLFYAIREWRPDRIGRIISWAVLGIEAAVLVGRGVDGGLLAMAVAAGFVAIVHYVPRYGMRIISGAIAGLILVAPFLFGLISMGADGATASTSLEWRRAIWDRVLDVIVASPLYGGGLGVLRSISDTISDGVFGGDLLVPNHAHNMFLQLWSELGAGGAILLALVVVMVGWRLPRPEVARVPDKMIAGVLGALVAVCGVTYDLWNDWWWGVSGLLVILVAVSAPLFSAEAKTEQPAREPDIPADHAPVLLTHGLANNFNLLRLLFAGSVAVFHIIYLGQLAPTLTEPDGALATIASLGVHGFFVLSGYLVYASCVHARSTWSYAAKRFRRLYPAYATVIVACVIGALLFSAEARANQYDVLKYLGWNLAFLNFVEPNLPGLFGTAPVSVVNGALWTLKIEVMFYLLLPVLVWAFNAAGKYKWYVAGAVYVGSEIWRLTLTGVGGAVAGPWAETLSYQLPGQLRFFVCGIVLYWLRDRRGLLLALAPFGVAMLALSLSVTDFDLLRPAGLGLVVIWVGLVLPRLVNVVRYGDVSYGLYMVHFPIAQALVAVGGQHNAPIVYLYAAASMSLAGALLLWWLIERPFLHRNSAYRMNSRDPENVLQLFKYRQKAGATKAGTAEDELIREGA